MATGISARLNQAELKRFGFTVAVPLALLAVLGVWRGHTIVPAVLGALAVGLGGIALVAPEVLAPVQRIWMVGANIVGWFNTRVLLGLVYFVVMTPTGIVMRLVGRDPLNRRLRDRPSYWVERNSSQDPRGSMERHF